MKQNAQDLIGKTISAVLIKKSDDLPRSQLFLVFDDRTYFEFYADTPIRPTGGPDPGTLADVLRYGKERAEVVFQAYPRKGF